MRHVNSQGKHYQGTKHRKARDQALFVERRIYCREQVRANDLLPCEWPALHIIMDDGVWSYITGGLANN